MVNWQSEYTSMISDCERREDLLSDWETDFIDSVSTRLRHGGTLSSKQIECLEKIWDKVTSERPSFRA